MCALWQTSLDANKKHMRTEKNDRNHFPYKWNISSRVKNTQLMQTHSNSNVILRILRRKRVREKLRWWSATAIVFKVKTSKKNKKVEARWELCVCHKQHFNLFSRRLKNSRRWTNIYHVHCSKLIALQSKANKLQNNTWSNIII